MRLLLVLVVAAVACNPVHGSASDPASTHRLPEAQIGAFEQRAKNGDADAALALSNHYLHDDRDNGRRAFWLDVAVDLGHPVAMANKAADLAQGGTVEACGKARRLYAGAIDAAADDEQRKAFSEALAWMDEEGSPCATSRPLPAGSEGL